MQVGGLWKNTSANGDTYLQGKLGPNVCILIFKNKFKTAPNQPDFQIYFAPVERREADGFASADETQNGSATGQRRIPAPQRADAPPTPGDAEAPPHPYRRVRITR